MCKVVFAFPYKLARLCRQLLFGIVLINLTACALFTEKLSPAEMMLPREQTENGIITPEKPRFDDLPIGSISKQPLIQKNFTQESNLKKPYALSSDDWFSLKDGLLLAIENDTKDSIEWNNPLTKASGKITRLDNFGKCQRLIYSVVKANKDYWYETTLCKNSAKFYDIQMMKAWL
jgi:hypothetical protein